MIIIKRIREKSFSPDEKSCEGLSKTLITFLNSYEKKNKCREKDFTAFFIFSRDPQTNFWSRSISFLRKSKQHISFQHENHSPLPFSKLYTCNVLLNVSVSRWNLIYKKYNNLPFLDSLYQLYKAPFSWTRLNQSTIPELLELL